MSKIYGTIIIGSGPAGYTAAIYAARSNLSVLVLQGYQAGGQLMLTSEVENYPGFENGILGPEMMEKFEKQAQRFGAELLPEDVTAVDFSERPFKVTTDFGEYFGQTVIIATGASAKWLELPAEKRLQGRGISACATCDGFFFKGKDVVVVGGGDTAMEEASFLTRYANTVTLIHRRDTFRASKIMQERVLKNPKITCVMDSEVVDILGEQSVEAVKLRNVKTGKEQELATQGVFVAIGHQPNTSLFKDIITMDEHGYIIPVEHTMTNIPGVFVAGDVTDHRYRQAITAAGEGCKAAIDVERWLEAQGLDVGVESWD
ncbi:thioredoxin reductase (NADPH) [Thermosporothrix hazakensis]|jgi:thioredoxin reductase (NADPH)|uniref:Thioredoxin reductase n=2 Tax=Thermosporothrix TaxID=768650 RepID=A0A326U6S0_THEHA|nr:thioredoxin-disulfide reductase [Thermosporothrix hazakensis]PZW30503.1 thioredoxin reductase (NADPH) [Thermosporothrix hazakensis]BBH91217.1 thioredoxin reductase [Thermosporothrix sp. COM3]GCE49363.1 thioredoxin reductase [Thermosporothrix hazakensis]